MFIVAVSGLLLADVSFAQQDVEKILYKAKVIKIERVPDFSEEQDFRATQVLDLKFTSGELKGDVVQDVDYPLPGIRGEAELLPLNANLIVDATNFDQELGTGLIIEDQVRDYKLVILFLAFMFLVLLVSGFFASSLKMISTAPSGPITAISALAQA